MRYPIQGRPPTFAEHRNGVIVGVKVWAVIRPIASHGLTHRCLKALFYKGFGGARGIRTLDPSCPGYRISSAAPSTGLGDRSISDCTGGCIPVPASHRPGGPAAPAVTCASILAARRGVRVVEGAALEKRCG
jgi:hypothetical protein